MRNVILAAALLATSLCLAPAAATAQDSGFSLGVRAAYAVPFGTATDGTSLNDLAAGAVPLQVDADYRLSREWLIGVSFAYGPVRIADEAKRSLEAAGLSDVGGHRQQVLSLQVARHFNSDGSFRPWVGLSGGYEWTRFAGGKLPSGMETEIGMAGPTGAFMIGGDFAVSPRVTVGPYVAVDLGRYGRNLVWVEDGDTTSTSIDDKAVHQWLRAGVKLAWRF
jgi:outer membrane protein W